MKKFIPALCMLLVAAALMGTSTFAWFSMNKQVNATGMQVKAVASKNLLISTAQDSGYGASVDLSGFSETTMTPVSTIGGNQANPAFFKLDAEGSMTQDSYAMAPDTTMTDEVTAGTDYAKATVYLKTVGAEDGNNLSATINVTAGGSKELDKALRVMLVDKTGAKTYIYSPVSGAAYGTMNGETPQAIGSLDSAKKGNKADVTSVKTNGSTLISTMAKETVYAFDIYVWYEGEDTNCTAAKSVDISEITIGIQFDLAS